MEANTRPKVPLYRAIALAVVARLNCIYNGNSEWANRHEERIHALVKAHLPHGSGLDGVLDLDLDLSKADRLVISTEFHHMTESGFYDGWTKHQVIVTPSLMSAIDLRITGKDRNQIKDYLHETFQFALTQLVDPWEPGN